MGGLDGGGECSLGPRRRIARVVVPVAVRARMFKVERFGPRRPDEARGETRASRPA